MKKGLLFCLFLLLSLFSMEVMAQRTVSGTVTDPETGEPIPGATVLVQGTSIGTATDENGNYSISIPTDDAVLEFSGVGLETQTITVGAQSRIDVAVAADSKQLGEIVVVGYGELDRRELTGSVSKVSAQTIQGLPVAGVDQALQGRVAGVQITTNSGTPGGGITVRVRGSSSISASNQPLYVIDGFPMTTGDASQLGFGGQSMNVLNDLNPADIESIEILKDASSAAIYGSRGSNGVILITTKRGKNAKTQANFNSYIGFSEVWKTPGFLNRDQYLSVMNDALVNDGFITRAAADANPYSEFIDFYYSAAQAANLRANGGDRVNTDWIRSTLRTAITQNYEFNISGGNEKTKYYVSGAYYDQEGLVINSRFKRFSTSVNLDHRVNDKIAIGLSSKLTRSVNSRIVSDNTLFGPFANSLASSPLFTIYETNGRYTRPNFFYSNPVAEGTENDDLGVSLRAIANAYIKYEPVKNLVISGKASVDLLNYQERRYTPDNYAGSSSAATGGAATNTQNTTLKWVLELTANYDFEIGNNHKFSVLAGINRELNTINTTLVGGIGFPGEKFRFLSNAATINAGANAETYWGLFSYFARVNYSLLDRYLLSVNFRADGSSRFGEKNRFGYFPAVSVGWRISEEGFMDNLDFVSELKLRASVGLTGNQDFGNFGYRYLYGGGNYLDRAGILQTQIGNPNLKWESTQQTDIGLDVGLFDGRINMTVDYYIKTTRDLLFNTPVATQNGFGGYASNIGSVENKGWEFSLSTVNFKGDNRGFRWTTDFNVSFNQNKVLSLYNGQDVFYGFGGSSLVLREGQPIGTFYGLIADGVFSRTSDVPDSRKAVGILAGDMNYRDLNGDGVITDADRTVIGNAQPISTGGLTNSFSFKGFDLSVFLQFSYGNKTWNATGNFSQGMLANFFEDNQTSAVLRRWRNEGDVTDVPRATTDVSANRNNESNTTRFVEDGSFLRIKNVMLGYNFKPELVNRLKLRSLRLYVQVQNLFTFTKYSGFDPEVNFAGTSNTTLGVDFYTFPQPRTFTFGLNVGL